MRNSIHSEKDDGDDLKWGVRACEKLKLGVDYSGTVAEGINISNYEK